MHFFEFVAAVIEAHGHGLLRCLRDKVGLGSQSSFAEIGSACLLSRAVGGLMDKLVILVMPGSRAAVELAMRKIILPELPHIVHEARKT